MIPFPPIWLRLKYELITYLKVTYLKVYIIKCWNVLKHSISIDVYHSDKRQFITDSWDQLKTHWEVDTSSLQASLIIIIMAFNKILHVLHRLSLEDQDVEHAGQVRGLT